MPEIASRLFRVYENDMQPFSLICHAASHMLWALMVQHRYNIVSMDLMPKLSSSYTRLKTSIFIFIVFITAKTQRTQRIELLLLSAERPESNKHHPFGQYRFLE